MSDVDGRNGDSGADGAAPGGGARAGGRSDAWPEAGAPDESFLARFKELKATSYAIKHRVSVLVLFLIIAVGGILSYRAIPKESFPEMEVPMIAVNTLYPGVAPADVESLVTRHLEDELNTISDLKELTSTSVEGYSSIIAEFETDVDLNEALQKVREKVDLAKPELPQDAEDPMIVEFNFSEIPIMQVNVSGEYGLVRLKEIGEELQDRIEQLPAILRADLRGGLEREVQIDVNLSKLKFYGLAFDDVVEAIQGEHVNIPGGSIDVGALKYLVRVDGEFEDPALIEELVVSTVEGRPVYVRDVATVDFGFAERDSYARLDETPVVTLDIVKRSGYNVIETAEAVKGIIAGMEPLFPPSTSVKITSDQTKDIRNMVSSLENNIVSGLLLILGVLFFFLGIRTSWFVALSIPMSMLLSFMVMGLLGITMNMVVLFSLILALGMLVDNAIVIVENIYRYVEEGWERSLAARKATGEVAMPVIAATFTTLAAFTPLMFWPGQVGEFMGYLPQTLIITLSSSLFVALIIIPTLCSMFLRLDDEPVQPWTPEARWTLVGVIAAALLVVAVLNPLTAVLFVATAAFVYGAHHFVLGKLEERFQESWLPTIIAWYEARLRWALLHRWKFLGTSAMVLIGSFVIFGAFNSGVEYFPEDIPPRQVLVDIEAPVGTRADFTDGIAGRIEKELQGKLGMSDAESVVSTVGGGGAANSSALMGGGPGGPNAGRVTVTFMDYEDREHDPFEVLGRMQASVGTDIAGAEIAVRQPQEGPAQGPPVNIEIVGENPAVLRGLADRVIQEIEGSPVYAKLVRLENDMEEARPELAVSVDRERAALYDLSTAEVGRTIRAAIQGIDAAEYRTGKDEYDIVVRLREEDRASLSDLAELTVMSEGDQVPLLSVARWDVSEGYGSIQRKDLDRMATVSSDVRSGYNSNAVLAEVQGVLRDFQANGLPPGYTMRFTGQQEDQAEATAFLANAFLIALALIGFILVSQFNSVVKPVIILTSVIMSTAGVVLGLVAFRMPFVIIMTGVGVISLAGIVVNNAIVLIDYIDILRERDGMDRREALVEGGKTRFRPVVLTAITTALGLVPLAVGLNFDFFGLYGSLSPELYWGGEQAAWWGPMAVAVIAGIIFATFLTLVLVPVMYSLVDDIVLFFKRHYTHQLDGQGAGAASDEEPAGHPGEPAEELGTPPRPVEEREPAPVYSRQALEPSSGSAARRAFPGLWPEPD